MCSDSIRLALIVGLYELPFPYYFLIYRKSTNLLYTYDPRKPSGYLVSFLPVSANRVIINDSMCNLPHRMWHRPPRLFMACGCVSIGAAVHFRLHATHCKVCAAKRFVSDQPISAVQAAATVCSKFACTPRIFSIINNDARSKKSSSCQVSEEYKSTKD